MRFGHWLSNNNSTCCFLELERNFILFLINVKYLSCASIPVGVEKIYSLNEGIMLVKAARNALELNIMSPRFRETIIEHDISEFNREHGVFVRLMHYPTNSNRGHSFLLGGKIPLSRSLLAATIHASKNDRFVPVSHLEFKDMIIAVGIIFDYKEIKGKTMHAIRKEIGMGRRGLAIQSGYNEGFVFADNYNMLDINEDILHELCEDAGLSDYSWKNAKTRLYGFEAQVFMEREPYGSVEEIETR